MTKAPPIELTVIALWANSADDKLTFFLSFFFFIFSSSYFSHNTTIGMSCKLSPQRKQFAWNVKSFLGRKIYLKMLWKLLHGILRKHLRAMHSINSI